MVGKARKGHKHLTITNIPDKQMWALRRQSADHKCKNWKDYLNLAFKAIKLMDEMAQREADGGAEREHPPASG